MEKEERVEREEKEETEEKEEKEEEREDRQMKEENVGNLLFTALWYGHCSAVQTLEYKWTFICFRREIKAHLMNQRSFLIM